MHFFVQTSTNVFVGYTNAALMHFATIPKGLTSVHVNLDSLEMDENVKVNVEPFFLLVSASETHPPMILNRMNVIFK